MSRRSVINALASSYKYLVKPIFFQFDPLFIHENMVATGEFMGNISPIKSAMSSLLRVKDPSLSQTVAGIHFENPIGLAAGFDYEAQLTQTLSAIGFGFQSIGTLTNLMYEGNPGTMLGRLPKSQSLMVNKGYKNLGIRKTLKNLEGLNFDIPVGISIGRSNDKSLKTQKGSVIDIMQAFTVAHNSSTSHSFYELNISCPNLFGNISFYPSENLEQLLSTLDTLELDKPVFVKMPIEKSDEEVLEMLKVIAKHNIAGIIIGNLQKDRKDPALDPDEVKNFPVGHFSGKPTFNRSNQLIKLAYRHYKKRFVIIGCGGVFNAEDAYLKIQLGATLIQLITGMIFNGPQLIAEINLGLLDLLKRDRLKNISQAIGSKNK